MSDKGMMRFFLFVILGILLAGGLIAFVQPTAAFIYPTVDGYTSGALVSSATQTFVLPASSDDSLKIVCFNEYITVTATWPSPWFEAAKFGSVPQHCGFAFFTGISPSTVTVTLSAAAEMPYVAYSVRWGQTVTFGVPKTGTGTAISFNGMIVTEPTSMLMIGSFSWDSATGPSSFSSGTYARISKGIAAGIAIGMEAEQYTADNHALGDVTLASSVNWRSIAISISPRAPFGTDCGLDSQLPGCPATQPSNALPSVNLLALVFLGSIWLVGAFAGTILRTGFFVILGGISALAFAITAWTTTGELFSSTLLFAAAVLTLAWVPFMADRERTPE